MAVPKELQLLEEWKTRLGLQDWVITLITNVKQDDLSEEDADGDIEYVESTKCAKIQIIDPEKRLPALKPFDFEECLVHELLHCKMSLLADVVEDMDWYTKIQARYVHQLIDDIARALVSAKRSTDK